MADKTPDTALNESLDDRMLRRAKQGFGIISAAAILGTGTYFGLLYARRDDIIRVFVSALIGWSGYLFGHYLVTGRIVHQSSEQRVIPKNRGRILRALGGVGILTAGATIGTMGTARADTLSASLGFTVAFLGYVIVHYELTGTLL